MRRMIPLLHLTNRLQQDTKKNEKGPIHRGMREKRQIENYFILPKKLLWWKYEVQIWQHRWKSSRKLRDKSTTHVRWQWSSLMYGIWRNWILEFQTLQIFYYSKYSLGLMCGRYVPIIHQHDLVLVRCIRIC